MYKSFKLDKMIKSLWSWKKKFDICDLTDIKCKYVLENIFEYTGTKCAYEVTQKNKNFANIFKQQIMQKEKAKQAFFEMRLLLRINVLTLNGNSCVKTINFPKWNSKEAKNFNPKVLSDENILGVCKKFNECFVKPINPSAYKEYEEQIDALGNPSPRFVPWEPKQFYELCQNIIDVAVFTEQEIKNMEFGINKNTNHNQQDAIPNLKTRKEKNL